MLPDEIFFVFHPRLTWEVWRNGGSVFSLFGHVEAFGYTCDDTWFFFDPGRAETYLTITHMHDEVNKIMASKFEQAELILSIKTRSKLRVPLHGPMNCVTQCAALVGLRAFTPAGLKRKLLQNDAKVIHEKPKAQPDRNDAPDGAVAPGPQGEE